MSLLAALKNKTQPLATAIPAIRATRKAETGGGIAGIARIAVAAGQNEKDESANDGQQASLVKGVTPLANTPAAVDTAMDTVITNNHVAHGGVSVVMRTHEGAVEYAALIAQGVGYAEAFSRAAAFEDNE